jgi:hypothetical protein
MLSIKRMRELTVEARKSLWPKMAEMIFSADPTL